jgi:hypothetical protein
LIWNQGRSFEISIKNRKSSVCPGGAAQRLVERFDDANGGCVFARFEARDGLLADAGEFGLAETGSAAITDEAAGNGGAGKVGGVG